MRKLFHDDNSIAPQRSWSPMKTHKRVWKDPVVEEVRAAGAKIAKECGYDLHRMIKRFRQIDVV